MILKHPQIFFEDALLRIVLGFEDSWFVNAGDNRPTVIIAVAGRSNGLGPTIAGNTTLPVISCPPLSADWGAQDIWSSLRLPSGQFYHSCYWRQVIVNSRKLGTVKFTI